MSDPSTGFIVIRGGIVETAPDHMPVFDMDVLDGHADPDDAAEVRALRAGIEALVDEVSESSDHDSDYLKSLMAECDSWLARHATAAPRQPEQQSATDPQAKPLTQRRFVMSTEATIRNYPLPEWPAHLPAPTVQFGISEDGSGVPDMWLTSGDRRVYMQARKDQKGRWYDDIDADPDWAGETQETRTAVAAYGSVVLDRFMETMGDAWHSVEGEAFLSLVEARTFATGVTETERSRKR